MSSDAGRISPLPLGKELAGKANQVWDSVCSNLMYANIDGPLKDLEYSLTEQAVEKHVEAMKELVTIRKQLETFMEREISPTLN